LVSTSLAAVEVGTRRAWRPEDGLAQKAAGFAAAARADERNLVILGTCLPEQHLHADLLEAELGGGWVVYNLGNEATTPLDWHLVYTNRLPRDRVDGLLLAYGARDLFADLPPWESRVTDIATWRQLPSLVEHGCETTECGLDLGLRLASVAWRYRTRLANRAWAGLGVLQRPTADPPAGSVASAASLWWLTSLLTAAGADGARVWTLALPTRPGAPNEADDARFRARAATALGAGGARPLTVSGLPPDAFTTDAHLTGPGAETLTRAVAGALREELGLVRPAAPEAQLPPRGPPRPPPPSGFGPPLPMQLGRGR
jgi:hypothetical protein